MKRDALRKSSNTNKEYAFKELDIPQKLINEYSHNKANYNEHTNKFDIPSMLNKKMDELEDFPNN